VDDLAVLAATFRAALASSGPFVIEVML
jgi:hypothetical protein